MIIMYKRVKKSIVDPIKEMIGDEYFVKEEFTCEYETNFKHYQIGDLHIKLMDGYDLNERRHYFFNLTAKNKNLEGCSIYYDDDPDDGVLIKSSKDKIRERFPAYDCIRTIILEENVEGRIKEIVGEFEELVKAASKSHKEKEARKGVTELKKREDLIAQRENLEQLTKIVALYAAREEGKTNSKAGKNKERPDGPESE